MKFPDAAVSQLFEEALDLAPEQRSAFLDGACRGQPDLRRQVEALLEENDRITGFLRTPAWSPQEDVTDQATVTDFSQALRPEREAASFLETPGMTVGASENPMGRTVSHYRVVEMLGGGGMGVVYKARDTRLQRFVALKFLADDFVGDVEALHRFQREARSASRINHPHICTVYDVGDDEQGRPFLAMELLEGETLRRRLERGGVPLPELLTWGIQISDALEAAHIAGVIHRDIKPANLFITARGGAKVLDFGLAQSVAAAEHGTQESTQFWTRPGQTRGTVAYMSPEQARGEQLDRRTDVFSFGVVLYEMVSGNPPFSGPTSAVVFEAILNRRPPSVLPAELDRIIAKALEKDRGVRYQTMGDLRADLVRLERGMALPVDAAELKLRRRGGAMEGNQAR